MMTYITALSLELMRKYRTTIGAALGTILYFVCFVFAYRELEEGWTYIDCLYFMSATMSTVGYGDFSPSTSLSRVVTVFAILVGILYAFPTLGNALLAVTLPITRKGRAVLEAAYPQQKVDLDGDGAIEFTIPRHWTIYYSKNLLPSVLLNLVIQMISAAIFVTVEPGWTYGVAMYHCLVTATTVGYGDVAITTQDGRLWAVVQMLASVVLLAEMISTFGTLQAERASTLKRIAQLQRRIDLGMYDKLMQRAREMRPLLKRDGRGLTELEYVLAMAIELDMIEWKHLYPFVKQFRQLDQDGDGWLTDEDTLKCMQLIEAQRGKISLLRKRGIGEELRDIGALAAAVSPAYPMRVHPEPAPPPPPPPGAESIQSQ